MSITSIPSTKHQVVRESVDFARRDGEASAELTVYGLAAVVRALDAELTSGSLAELDGERVTGLAIAARILADSLAHRIGNCPPNAERVAA